MMRWRSSRWALLRLGLGPLRACWIVPWYSALAVGDGGGTPEVGPEGVFIVHGAR